jgi:inactivated superfamily I helicase/RecB family exonuclease
MAEVRGVPPGADFPAALASLLPAAPREAAMTTVIVNTARMRTRLEDTLRAQGPRVLPRIHLVTDLSALLPPTDLPRPEPALRRRLVLAQAVRALIAAQPDLAPAGSQFALADSLIRLVEEATGEDVPLERILALDLGAQSGHWQRAQAFLRLAAPLMADDAAPGPAAMARAQVARLAEVWQTQPPEGPVVVAGSTGSRGTTARLMQIVAGLPQGMLVLPGFDFDLPQAVWDRMADRLAFEDHPQYRYGALLRRLGCGPSEVRPLGTAPDPARGRVLSLSLRPAPVTDQWLAEGAAFRDLPGAMAGMTLITAETPRDEATAIALALRGAVEDGRRAALITPDRTLARRVTAQLDRWGLIPDDSAGRPLAQSPHGRLLRLTAAMGAARPTTGLLLAVLKHPLVRLLPDRGDHLRATGLLELYLRRRAVAFPDAAILAGWDDGPLSADFAAALAPLIGPPAGHDDLPAHMSRHRALLDALAPAGPFDDAAAEATARLMQALAAEAGHGGRMDAAEYRALIDDLLEGQNVTETVLAHPGLFIWGTIEARVQGVDLMVLGSLNEGTWPAPATPDHWMNRAMRAAAGLLLPERTIGLSAHDVSQAMGAPQVILTRSRRAGEAETVPSRWLNRLTNLLSGLPAGGGPAALAEMTARGDRWLALARALQAPAAAVARAVRPKPVPPPGIRPARLSASDIRALIRNPYEVYARRLLRLRPLPALQAEPDAQARGTVFHRILQQHALALRDNPAQDRLALLAGTAADVIAADVAWPMARLLWLARLLGAADGIFAFHDAHPGQPVALDDAEGRLQLWPGGPEVTARPDRIDVLDEGGLHIIDYKSGAAPKRPEIARDQKQLLVEAAIAAGGGFGAALPPVARVSYLGLGSPEQPVTDDLTLEAIAAFRADLEGLLRHYDSPGAGFAARRAMPAGAASDYDHLSRHGEWDDSDPPAAHPVGHAP